MIIIGCIFFVLLGITGSAAIYYSSVILRGSSQISSYVGIAYAAGVFLQFINNNIIKSYLYVRNLHKGSFFNCILSEDKEIFMYNGKK